MKVRGHINGGFLVCGQKVEQVKHLYSHG